MGALIALALELAHMEKRVIVAGLDMTFAGEPFGPIPALMAVADEVMKLSAVCMVCGSPAIHSQRLGANQELVVVGAAVGVYEAQGAVGAFGHPWMSMGRNRWSCRRFSERFDRIGRGSGLVCWGAA